MPAIKKHSMAIKAKLLGKNPLAKKTATKVIAKPAKKAK